MELRDASEAESQLLAELPSERYIHELLMLYEIGQSLCSIHDLDLLLRFTMERVVALLEVESSSIILLDEERQDLYFKVADNIRSDTEPKLREIRFPADQGISGWVIRKGVSALVPDVEQDPRFYRGVGTQTGSGCERRTSTCERSRGRWRGSRPSLARAPGCRRSMG